MKFNEIFNIGGISQSIGGTSTFLNEDDCVVSNKTRSDSSVVLILKRESDGEEGRVHVRVKEQFKDIEDQLLGWVFSSTELVGLTISQIRGVNTGLSISNFQGRLRLDN